MPPPREFGRRSLKAPEPVKSLGRRRSGGEFAHWFGFSPMNSDGDRLIVATTISGVALAGVGVLLLQFGILFGRRMANGIAETAMATDPSAIFAAPPSGFVAGLVAFTLTLVWGGLQLGALYALIGHAVLRWLRLTSLLAYTVGGAGAAYLFLASWALHGDHLQWSSLIDLAAGAIAGAMFRMGSGLRSLEGSGRSVASWSDESLEPSGRNAVNGSA